MFVCFSLSILARCFKFDPRPSALKIQKIPPLPCVSTFYDVISVVPAVAREPLIIEISVFHHRDHIWFEQGQQKRRDRNLVIMMLARDANYLSSIFGFAVNISRVYLVSIAHSVLLSDEEIC